jgi:hypothetical protein
MVLHVSVEITIDSIEVALRNLESSDGGHVAANLYEERHIMLL